MWYESTRDECDTNRDDGVVWIDSNMFNVVFVVSGTNPCLYNGVTYANGAEFAAIDGCNECECANGVTTCSTEVCGNSGK